MRLTQLCLSIATSIQISTQFGEVAFSFVFARRASSVLFSKLGRTSRRPGAPVLVNHLLKFPSHKKSSQIGTGSGIFQVHPHRSGSRSERKIRAVEARSETGVKRCAAIHLLLILRWRNRLCGAVRRINDHTDKSRPFFSKKERRPRCAHLCGAMYRR